MADAPLSPEEIAHRSFPTSFRGFDTGEVRAYLARVADELRAATAHEREFERRVIEAEHRAAHPVLDQTTLSRAVGAEMARLLASAEEAAQEVRAKAEDNAGRILREAHDHAQRVRDDAEAVLVRRSAEAEKAAGEIRELAQHERAAVLERAEAQAAANLGEVEVKARTLVEDAQTERARILADLATRRRMVNAQVQQLRAGRTRLLDAYRVVRRTLDEVSDELERVEVEAKAAAGEAARRQAETPEGSAGEGVDETGTTPAAPPLAAPLAPPPPA
ncbi:MAG: DivIVA domain-containing protein, partial [Acidimicrobiales bacterium]